MTVLAPPVADSVASLPARGRVSGSLPLRLDVGIVMGLAGLANLGMLVLAAAVFAAGSAPVESLPALHDGLRGPRASPGAGVAVNAVLVVGLLT